MADEPGGAVRASDETMAVDEAARARSGLGAWSFCHLPFAYQLLVWAIRHWNCESVDDAQRWASIRLAFAKVGAEDATIPFLRLMEVIQAGAAVPILIGEGASPLLPDEARLAEAIARATRSAAEPAHGCIRRMLAPAAARAAEALIAETSLELRQAGLSFSRMRCWGSVLPRPARVGLH